MKPHTKKWRAIPSTLHSSNPASVRMDIVDDGAEFSPAFVAGDIMPEDARLMAAAPKLIAALEACLKAIDLNLKLSDEEREAAEIDAVSSANSAIREAKGQP